MNKPIIGIVPRCDEDSDTKRSIQYVFEGVRNSIIDSGGIPVVITPPNKLDYFNTKWDDFPNFTIEEEKIIDKYLDICDGIFLPGGYKITKFDKLIIEKAIDKDMPILGVCLGMQTLYSYNSKFENRIIESSINHKQNEEDKYAHKVKINKQSLLYKIVGKEEINVNSFHRREVYLDNPYFDIVGYSEDGIIEAIEMKNKKFIIGVQWHPEKMIDYDNEASLIMNSFIEASISYSKDKESKVVKL